jgi:hypothetical protein
LAASGDPHIAGLLCLADLAGFSEPSLMGASSFNAGGRAIFIFLDLDGSTLGAIARRA